MLVQKSTNLEPYGVGQDEFAMYEKCHQGQYLEAFDPMAMSFREAQHRKQLNTRQTVSAIQSSSGANMLTRSRRNLENR